MAERHDTGGLATVLRVIGARGGLVNDDGNKVDLFEAEDAPLPLPAKGKSGPKGGRPAGVPNRSTEAWASYLLSQHKSPLTVLATIMSQPLGELHAMLQDLADSRTRKRWRENGSVEEVRVLVDPLQVLKLQKDAAIALAPYVHKQQPKALEIQDRPRGVMLLGELGAEDAETVGSDDDLALPLAPEGKQQLSASDALQSDGLQSDAGGNDSNNNPLAYNGD